MNPAARNAACGRKRQSRAWFESLVIVSLKFRQYQVMLMMSPLISDVPAELIASVWINRFGEYTIAPFKWTAWKSFSPHGCAIAFELPVEVTELYRWSGLQQ